MAAPFSFDFFGVPFALYELARGVEIPLHQHSFDHGSIIVTGRVVVFDGAGKELEVAAPHNLLFAAGRPHGIRALSDRATVLNVMPPSRRPTAA
jgi:quercetin dioxygenase-like cupin family protein